MGKNRRRGKKKSLIPLYTIIPFLAFFSYIYLTTTLSPVGIVKACFNIEDTVKYETFKVSFQKDMDPDVQDMIKKSVEDIELNGVKRFEFVNNGKYEIKEGDGLENVIYSKEYIPVGHVYWIKGEVDMKDLNRVYVLEKDEKVIKALLKDVDVVTTQDLVSKLKEDESGVGLISVDDLVPSFKVLKLAGKYALEEDGGSFKLRYFLEGKKGTDFVAHVLKRNMELLYGEIGEINMDTVVKINMSGVVAISRGLASKMDSLKNYSYPAQSIGGFLGDADLTHVSNESSFVQGCTSYSGMRFCSRPEHLETLKKSGVDIVELTGNHNNDFGASNNAKSIQMIKDLGWDYFGGGVDITDASKILYKEVKGSKIAFVGYNYYDTMLGTAAIATSTRAGANSYSEEKLASDISKAKENADVVIVTFQFQECYSYPPSDVIYPICYKPLSSPDQKGVFRKAVDLGADIVVGTQAHQPQTYEVYNGGMIYYGLGNLYFDQHKWIGTRQGLILSLYIQDGKFLQSRLTPTYMDRNLIPRLASESEGNLLLDLLKKARTF